jgi:hypothetical protein
MERVRLAVAALVAIGLFGSGAAMPAAQESGKAEKAAGKVVEKSAAKIDRHGLIARSKVWAPTDIASKNLKTGPQGPGAFAQGSTITCDYFEKKMSGASPKFACRTPEGDELKVKYGGTNGEVYGEVAASRLLWALGFGADHMYSVRVICRGCPVDVGGIARANGERILDPAAVERKMPGDEMLEEWAWKELDLIDPAKGGASVAERDALKLLAVMIQHSDSKPQQQRLVCVDGGEGTGDCRAPLMMINDLGVTFGRANPFNQQPGASVNLAKWMELPIWKAEPGAQCIGNLGGSFTGTLKFPAISEEGRAFLAGLLTQLSDAQIRDMFEAARMHLRAREPERGRSGFATIDEWVATFKQKRAEIVEKRCA